MADTPTDDVTFVRRELVEALPRYMLIRDCIGQTVKNKGELYLPKPNPSDRSEENNLRYEAYIERAVFYGVTGRTLGGMVGQVYARDPEIKVPDLLKVVVDDATGTGLSLIQLSKDAMREAVAIGRDGIFVDYPQTNGPTTRKQQLDGEIRPTMTIYNSENITNWRHTKRGGKAVLSLVVLSEMRDIEGEFEVKQERQYRVLRLMAGWVYQMAVYRETPTAQASANPFLAGAVKKTWQIVEGPLTPVGSDGKPMTEIPFNFIGAINNDSTIDEPPLYDLSELNIAHYRNSADYEEASFIVGQPTPWFSGLTEDWVDEVLEGEVLLGARGAVMLPENSQAGLLQVSPNIMPMEAMKHKEAQMVALGARLVENRAVRRTLGEVKDANASETSILASCANNVSAAFTSALVWAGRFMGAATDGISFKLNTEFALTTMPADERNALIADMQAGAVSWTEVRTALRRAGVVFQSDEDARTEIEKWQEAEAKREAAKKPVPAAAQRPPVA